MRHEGLSQDFRKHSVLVLVLLLMASALVALSPTAPWAGLSVDAHAAGLANPAALEPHAPIHITGDDGFNTSNGVRGGTGTAAAPYPTPTGLATPPSLRNPGGRRAARKPS